MMKVQNRGQIWEEARKDNQLSTLRHGIHQLVLFAETRTEDQPGLQDNEEQILEQGVCQVFMWKYRKKLDDWFRLEIPR